MQTEGSIADIVLLPGDPLRAKYNRLKHFWRYKFVYNTVESMLVIQAPYKVKKFHVQGYWNGNASAVLYIHELSQWLVGFTVDRLGTCGAIQEDVHPIRWRYYMLNAAATKTASLIFNDLRSIYFHQLGANFTCLISNDFLIMWWLKKNIDCSCWMNVFLLIRFYQW